MTMMGDKPPGGGLPVFSNLCPPPAGSINLPTGGPSTIAWSVAFSTIDCDQITFLVTATNTPYFMRVQWSGDQLRWTYDQYRQVPTQASAVSTTKPSTNEYNIVLLDDGSAASVFTIPVAGRFFRVGCYANGNVVGTINVDFERIFTGAWRKA